MGSKGDPMLPSFATHWKTPHGMSGMDHTGKVGGGGEFAKQVQNWQTPSVADTEGGRMSRSGSRSNELLLKGQSVNWNTPTAAPEAPNKNSNQIDKPGSLGEQSKLWATPKASMADNGSDSGSAKRQQQGLNLGLKDQAAQWPTPCANDDNKTPEAHMAMKARIKGGPRNTITSLQVLVQQWPTPASRDYKGENSAPFCDRNGGKKGDQLPNFVKFHFTRQVRSSLDGQRLSPTTRTLNRRLNPMFVCWLMGWPIWWTNPAKINFASAAMASYRCKLRSHLSASCGG